jgi:hypothetical protein
MRFIQLTALFVAFCSSIASAKSVEGDSKVLRMKHWDGGFSFVALDTTASLTDLFDYDAFDAAGCEAEGCEAALKASNPRQVCIAGDLGQVCRVFATLSDNAENEYEAGLHELTSLTQCELDEARKLVRLQMKSRHDWERLAVGGAVELGLCD